MGMDETGVVSSLEKKSNGCLEIYGPTRVAYKVYVKYLKDCSGTSIQRHNSVWKFTVKVFQEKN